MALVVLAAKKFWILDPLYSALGTLLAWFYSVIPSYGVAIVLLTLAVRLVTFPLTAKQAKSQQEMQRVQPELKRLQAKYKNDKQKLNEEMMKLYKEHHVNPFGGCLPLLIQMPVLIVLYRLILGLTHKPNPKNIPTSSSLYHALKASGGKMVSWGIDLAKRAADVKGSKLPFYLVLVVLVVATGYYQQRQLTSRAPKDGVNPQMQMMGKVFPLIFGLISWSIPAGVVVYFLVSNIWQIGQQAVIFRRQGPPSGSSGTTTTEGADGGKKTGSSKAAPPERRGKGGGRASGGSGKDGGNRGRTSGTRGRDGGTRQKATGPKGKGQGRGDAKPAQGARGRRPGPAPTPAKDESKGQNRRPTGADSGTGPKAKRGRNAGTSATGPRADPKAKASGGTNKAGGEVEKPDAQKPDAQKPDGQASKPGGNADGERARSRQAENDKDGR
jgi:YidC/Oxa1 family membrane protein insertase